MFETYSINAGIRFCADPSWTNAREAVRVVVSSGHAAVMFDDDCSLAPVHDLPTAKAPCLHFTAELNGYALYFDAAETVTFATWEAGSAARIAARDARAELAACLAKRSLRGGA